MHVSVCGMYGMYDRYAVYVTYVPFYLCIVYVSMYGLYVMRAGMLWNV